MPLPKPAPTPVDILALIYGNGEDKPATIQFHSDPGHGWLQVPIALCKKLNIEDSITRFSFKDKDSYYLEEDKDLARFMHAVGIDASAPELRTFWEVCPIINHRDEAPCRKMRRATHM